MAIPLTISDVEIRGGPLVLATPANVDELEHRLGTDLPSGYREYVTSLGEGILNTFVRVLPPWRILAELDEHRGLMSAYWFWESGKVAFGQEEAIESIPVADTVDGDVLAFHPADRERIIILPRYRDRLYARPADLLEAINWVCSGGVIRRFGPKRYFEPFDSRVERSDQDGQPESGRPSATFAVEPPALSQEPVDVLMAYFAELRAVEEWALAEAGGPEAFDRDEPPDLDHDELFARSAEVHSRYCVPRLAGTLRHESVTLSSEPEHRPSAIRVLEEKQGADRTVIRTAEGSDFVTLRRYVLERSGTEWRIASQTNLGVEISVEP